MKTITLSAEDEIELSILRQQLELEVQKQRRKTDADARRRYTINREHYRGDDSPLPLWSPVTSEAERNAVKALAIIMKILS